MSLGDVAPWIWGDVCRQVESEMAKRSDLDAAARQGVSAALGVMLHSKPPGDGDRERCPVCSLCGIGRATPTFIRCDAGPGGVRFHVAREDDLARERPSAVLFCWSCLVDRMGSLDTRLELARRLLARSKEGTRHLPIFDAVFDQRLIRRVTGARCDVCGGPGTALRGPPGVTVCLSCWEGAEDAHDAERRRLDEERRRRDEDFDRRLEAYLAEMWKIAREDAAGAMRALERRGELSPPPGEPSLRPPRDEGGAGSPPVSEEVSLPEGLVPRGAIAARAVVERLRQIPLAARAAAWWRDARPTAVSLGWKLMEAEDEKRGAKGGVETGSLDRGGGARVPSEPPRAPDRWSARRGRRRPPIPPPRGSADERAREAIEILDSEVERALRHDATISRDLMGDSRAIHLASAALDEKALSRRMLERFLQSISMLRQIHELGVSFNDYTGDELVVEEMSDYEHLASRVMIGVHGAVHTAMAGGVIVSGGTAAERARVAWAIRQIVVTWTRAPFPGFGSSPFQYVEAEDLYAMSPEGQEEVRRKMLITPPVATVLGADDLDRFIEETPRRCSARIVTYLFMNGQEHLDLSDGKVHVGPPPPPGPPPKR